ncbi:hypothetical protein BC829DRAFT_416716 [Chytridium lagenaria]|nr:hypothetical protein BC829DRAFT_416716 [Chytridium lagenaria]
MTPTTLSASRSRDDRLRDLDRERRLYSTRSTGSANIPSRLASSSSKPTSSRNDNSSRDSLDGDVCFASELGGLKGKIRVGKGRHAFVDEEGKAGGSVSKLVNRDDETKEVGPKAGTSKPLNLLNLLLRLDPHQQMRGIQALQTSHLQDLRNLDRRTEADLKVYRELFPSKQMNAPNRKKELAQFQGRRWKNGRDNQEKVIGETVKAKKDLSEACVMKEGENRKLLSMMKEKEAEERKLFNEIEDMSASQKRALLEIESKSWWMPGNRINEEADEVAALQKQSRSMQMENAKILQETIRCEGTSARTEGFGGAEGWGLRNLKETEFLIEEGAG